MRWRPWILVGAALLAAGAAARADEHVSPFKTFELERTISPSHPGQEGFRLRSVAFADRWLAVGSYVREGKKFNPSVHLFRRTGEDRWRQETVLTTRDRRDAFGYSVALDGRTLAVGAHLHSDFRGAVYVFRRHGKRRWVLEQKLRGDAEGSQQFGYAVALSGDTLVVGSGRALAARVFQRRAGARPWRQVGSLEPADPYDVPFHGRRVAVDGRTAVVGGNQGAAVYERDGDDSSWREVAILKPSWDPADTMFGVSVAVAEDLAVVGAPGTSPSGSEAGSVHLFRREKYLGRSTWLEERHWLGPTQERGWFGWAVATDGRRVFVGCPGLDHPEREGAGALFVYERTNGATESWRHAQTLILDEPRYADHLAWKIARSGDRVAAIVETDFAYLFAGETGNRSD